MNETIILTISTHPSWGYLLQPVVATRENAGWMTIQEIATVNCQAFANLNESAKELVRLSAKYADKALMKSYSKEKTVTDFLKKVKQETIDTYIRPCIESYERKMVKLLAASGMPLYIRKSVKIRTLHESDRVSVPDEEASAICYFVKKSPDALLCYFIRVSEGKKEEIDLFGQTPVIVCQDPAIIILNYQLLYFNDIDVKKLLPFFTKKHIEIPANSESDYIRTFVAKCLIRYDVKSEGLSIRQVDPVKTAALSLENDLNNAPVLMLTFNYGHKKLPVDHGNKKIVLPEESDGKTGLSWFYPDNDWEKEQIRLLTDNGLVQAGLNRFTLDRTPEAGTETGNKIETGEEALPGLIDWIRAHQPLLQQFAFSQRFNKQQYFTGEISVQMETETGIDWFDLHCTAVFGSFRIPFVNFRQHILENIREYVLPDGSVAILPKEWFSRYYELALFGKKSGDAFRLKRSHFRLAETLNEGISTKKLSTPFDAEKPLPEPAGLTVSLRPYQQVGYSWLNYLYENKFGGCLADDMGLGKTVQTIAFLLFLANKRSKKRSVITSTPLTNQLSLFEEPAENEAAETRPSLIVMPTSLLHNWQNEIRRFAPSLKVYAYSGAKRIKSGQIDKVFAHFDLILTTYGTLRNDIDLFNRCQFRHLILDESQYVKNPGSQTHQSVKKVKALNKIALTGTPIENSLTDLWALFDIVNEGFLGSQAVFKKAYLNPIAKNNPEKEKTLLRLIQPFILRRTKEAVTPELPLLMEETVYCDMSEQQSDRYAREKNKLRNLLSGLAIDSLPSQIAFTTLQGLTKLRLLANHPVLLETDYEGDSGKFEQIIMRFETLLARKHKVLIFSSFVKHLRILADFFDSQQWHYAWLTGSTPADEREAEIKKFTGDPDINCFFISLKAGGVGLNLTAADYVFIIDPWWNPAAEMQALSRAHRIGQQKNVIVYRFISSGSIEEKIRHMQESKSQLADTFITASNPVRQMTKTDIENLLGDTD